MTSTNVPRWRYAACLFLFTALTTYVSSYPWTPGRVITSGTPWSVLFSIEWFRFGLRLTADVVLNVLFYVPFGVFGVWSLPPTWRWRSRLLPVVVAGSLLSLAVEVTQFEYSRVTSPVDLVTNSAGVLLGALLGLILQRTRGWQYKVGPAILLACLAVHTLLSYRLHLPVSEPRGWVLWAVGAWLVAGFFDIRAFGRPVAIAVFLTLVLALVAEELRPFNPTRQMSRFEWRPFIASIEGSSLVAGAVFSRKLFHYGSLLISAVYSRFSLALATIGLAAALLLLEQIQRFLPGRTPESTDAVIILLWAVILKLVLPPRAIV